MVVRGRHHLPTLWEENVEEEAAMKPLWEKKEIELRRELSPGNRRDIVEKRRELKAAPRGT